MSSLLKFRYWRITFETTGKYQVNGVFYASLSSLLAGTVFSSTATGGISPTFVYTSNSTLSGFPVGNITDGSSSTFAVLYSSTPQFSLTAYFSNPIDLRRLTIGRRPDSFGVLEEIGFFNNIEYSNDGFNWQSLGELAKYYTAPSGVVGRLFTWDLWLDPIFGDLGFTKTINYRGLRTASPQDPIKYDRPIYVNKDIAFADIDGTMVNAANIKKFMSNLRQGRNWWVNFRYGRKATALNPPTPVSIFEDRNPLTRVRFPFTDPYSYLGRHLIVNSTNHVIESAGAGLADRAWNEYSTAFLEGLSRDRVVENAKLNRNVQFPYYELGRAYSFNVSQLQGLDVSSNTGYCVYLRYFAMKASALGLSSNALGFQQTIFDTVNFLNDLESGVRLGTFVKQVHNLNDSLRLRQWAEAFWPPLLNTNPVNLIVGGNWSGADLFASVLALLAKTYGGTTDSAKTLFLKLMFFYMDFLPSSGTFNPNGAPGGSYSQFSSTAAAKSADNIFLAACYAEQRNLTQDFRDVLRWPITSSAINTAAAYTAPPSTMKIPGINA